MKLFQYLLFLALLSTPLLLTAQKLKQHQWKHRVLLLMADSFENESLRKQVTEFNKYPNDISERKIIFYEVTPQYYKKVDNDNVVELGQSALFDQYPIAKNKFIILLIGLDGGIKEKYQEFQSAQTIFDRIDTMPMRQRE